jgi:homoserine O-succinyltransferase
MPLKIETELHILRLLSNTPLQVEIDLVKTSTYISRNTSKDHLNQFYKTFDEIKDEKYDGMIMTGAPVDQIDFEEVLYWEEMKGIMDWASENVTSVLYICWAAQAGLYHHYGIPKHPLKEKMFGVFKHHVCDRQYPIIRGFDDTFLVPHSRNSELRKEDINKVDDLAIVSESDEAGIYIVASKNKSKIFVTGHSEYDSLTLQSEYERDVKKGVDITIPENYFPNNDPTKKPIVNWRSHGSLLFSNWLNYYIYQETPYKVHQIKGK